MKLSMLKEWKKAAIEAKKGFRVHFEIRGNGVIAGDYMPDRDELALPSENAAWLLVDDLNHYAPDNIVNIYVVDSQWIPVGDYKIGLRRKYPA